MVKIHIKKGDESQFLVDVTAQISMDDLLQQIIPVYNGRLKVTRICAGEISIIYHFSLLVCLFQVEYLKFG